MTCKVTRRELLAWLEGEMGEAEWLEIADHLGNCLECRREAEGWRQLLEALREAAPQGDVPAISEELWRRIKRRPVKKITPPFAFITLLTVSFWAGWAVRGRSVSRPDNPKVTMPPLSQTQGYPLFIPTPAPTLQATPVTPQKGEGDEKGDSGEVKGFIKTPLQVAPFRVSVGTRKSVFPQPPDQVREFAFVPFPTSLFGFEGVSEIPFERAPYDGKGTVSGSAFIYAYRQPDELQGGVISLEGIQKALPEPRAPKGYRLFIRVVDLKTKRVRTVQVDTTLPGHLKARWDERPLTH